MRITSLLYIVTIAAGVDLGACAGDGQAPGDELAAQDQTSEVVQAPASTLDIGAPENILEDDESQSRPVAESTLDAGELDGVFEGDEYQPQACHVKLLYCKDPRIAKRPASYCSSKCKSGDARKQAKNLCLTHCGSKVNCEKLYDAGSC